MADKRSHGSRPIVSLSVVFGVAVAMLAWLQNWTALRLPVWLYIALIGSGALVALVYGIYIYRPYVHRIRRWAFLLFLATGILSLAVTIPVLASYIGPQRTVTTWANERRQCRYHAVYDPPGPGVWGCDLTLYTDPSSSCDSPGDVVSYFTASACSWPVSCAGGGSNCSVHQSGNNIVGCNLGDTGCRRVAHTTTLPPATVSGSLQCPSPGNPGWCLAPASLALSGSEPVSGYSINAIEGTRNGSPFICNGVSSCVLSLLEGANSFQFWADSTFGDTSTMGNASLGVDTQPPSLAGQLSGTSGNNGWFRSAVTAAVSASDSASGVASVQYALDGGAWQSGTSVIVSVEGLHSIDFQAADNAGNHAQLAAPVSFGVDQTPPSLSVTPPSSSWYTSLPVTLSASASDVTSGMSSLQCSLDDAPCPSGSSVDINSDGIYSVTFRATDQAGNVSSWSGTVQADTTAPSFAPSVSGTTGLPAWYISAVTVSSGAIDATSGVAWVEYSLDGGAWHSGASVAVSADGAHTIAFRAADRAGNASTSATTTVRIDTTIPILDQTISGTSGLAGWYLSPVMVQANATDATSAVNVESSLDGGATWASSSSLVLGDGTYSLAWRATDQGGNSISSVPKAIQVDTAPPQSFFVSPAQGSAVVVAGNITLSGRITDAISGLAGAELSLDGGITWLQLSPDPSGTWNYFWDINSLPNGTHSVQVRSTDQAGNSEHAAQVTVTVDNDAPHVDITASFFLWQAASVHITPAAAPVAGARIIVSHLNSSEVRQFNYSADQLPTGFQWDGIQADGKSAPFGLYTVKVEAWDAFGHTGSASGTLIILLPAWLSPRPTATPTNTPGPTAISSPQGTFTPTATHAPAALFFSQGTSAPQPTAMLTSTPGVAVVTFGSPPTSEANPLPESGVLWGAEASAAIAAVTALAAETRRKRKEKEAQEAAAAAQFNAAQVAQEAQFATYMAQLNAERKEVADAAADRAAALNTLPSDVLATLFGLGLGSTPAEDAMGADEAIKKADQAAGTPGNNQPPTPIKIPFHWPLGIPPFEIPLGEQTYSVDIPVIGGWLIEPGLKISVKADTLDKLPLHFTPTGWTQDFGPLKLSAGVGDGVEFGVEYPSPYQHAPLEVKSESSVALEWDGWNTSLNIYGSNSVSTPVGDTALDSRVTVDAGAFVKIKVVPTLCLATVAVVAAVVVVTNPEVIPAIPVVLTSAATFIQNLFNSGAGTAPVTP